MSEKMDLGPMEDGKKIWDLIQERQQIEIQLRDSEKRYRDLLEHLPVGVYQTTPDGKIIESNQALAELLGYNSPADLKDTNVNQFYVHEQDRRNHLEKLDESLTYFSEFELWHKDGHVICVRDYPRAVLSKDGKVEYYSGVLVDITEQREAKNNLQKALEELEDSNRDREKMIVQLKNLSLMDDLTGLYNRRGFFAAVEERMQKACERGTKIYLLFMDLDNLKWINDSHGHQIGDQALVCFADILNKALRRSDTKGRLGGDEFAILARQTTNDIIEILVFRLKAYIQDFNTRQEFPFHLSVSIGISIFDPQDPCSIDELIAQADRLMYEQKQVKRTR